MAPTGPSRNQPAVTEMATSPLSRLPRSPLRIRRAFSATTLLDALRELARNDSARDALMAELGPLLARRPRQRAAHSVETRTLAALVLGLGVLVLVTRSAHNHEASARVLALAATPPQPPALPPRPTSTKLELAVLGACGTVAGLGLARWRPARVLLRRFSAALVEAAMSNGAVHVHVPPQPLTSVLGHARRIAHALLPSSAVEWLLVALNVLLVSRLYLFTQSLEFVAVIDWIHMLLPRTEWLRRFKTFCEAQMRARPGLSALQRSFRMMPLPTRDAAQAHASSISAVHSWLGQPALRLRRLVQHRMSSTY